MSNVVGTPHFTSTTLLSTPKLFLRRILSALLRIPPPLFPRKLSKFPPSFTLPSSDLRIDSVWGFLGFRDELVFLGNRWARLHIAFWYPFEFPALMDKGKRPSSSNQPLDPTEEGALRERFPRLSFWLLGTPLSKEEKLASVLRGSESLLDGYLGPCWEYIALSSTYIANGHDSMANNVLGSCRHGSSSEPAPATEGPRLADATSLPPSRSSLSQSVLTTCSLMTAADVDRLGSSGSPGCLLSPPDEDEPICSTREPECTNFFFFYRDYLSRLGREPATLKGLTSLRSDLDKKLFSAFSDSFKHFKNAFFKVVATFDPRMEENPKYLSYVRLDAGAGTKKAPRKQAAPEPQKKKAVDAAAVAKKAKVGETRVAPPSPPTGRASPEADPPATDTGKEVLTPIRRVPHLRTRFQLLLLESASNVVHNVHDYLCKALRLSQAYLHLRGYYVGAAGEVRRLKLDLEMAEEKAKRLAEEKQQAEGAKGRAEEEKDHTEEEKGRLEEELNSFKVATGKAIEELLLTEAALDQANSKLADMRSAQSRSIEAMKTLTQQHGDLVTELAETRGALEEEKNAHLEAVEAAAADCFRMALAHIRHLNPEVQLNLAGHDHRSFIKGGVLVPPPSSPEDELVSLVDEGQGGQVGEEASSVVPLEGDGSPGEEAASPS
ncbi:hypothetical protein K1719_043108 [Acacia pycnantha]|nr:hypothetical protein K1719_043108 [Acacia pycnantha]